MTEENNRALKKFKCQQNLIDIILVIILVGLVVVIAMNFMGPTIPDEWSLWSGPDPCGPCLCGEDGECFYPSPVQPTPTYTCSLEKCSAWKDGLPNGKLVVIIPKTVTIGNSLFAHLIGFSYPLSDYSKDEIRQITQHHLEELSLSENEAHVIELDVLMDTMGYFSIDIPNRDLHLSNSSNPKYIPPDRLSEWRIPYPVESIGEGVHDFRVVFHYSRQVSSCRKYCEALGQFYLVPVVNVEVRIK